jgi:ornithine decarboxylase
MKSAKVEVLGSCRYYYDFNKVVEQVHTRYNGPVLYMDLDGVRQKIELMQTNLPDIKLHYAVKCNPTKEVLEVIDDANCNFEVASVEELTLLQFDLGIIPTRILYSNPVKPKWMLDYFVKQGVEWFVADNLNEVKRIAAAKPDALIYLRMHTTSAGSVMPLSGKFGISSSDIEDVIKYASANKVNLSGVGFHVGSQCVTPANWKYGLTAAKQVFESMQSSGLNPNFLNIGGGFPVQMKAPLGTSIKEIANVINDGISDFKNTHIVAEPGRFLVGDCGVFVCQVINTIVRNGMNWAYLDAGLFGGLFEIHEGMEFEIRSSATGPNKIWTIAGPTCDSFDIISKHVNLPSNLKEGDFVYFMNAGAYTVPYASTFNGFPMPNVEFL